MKRRTENRESAASVRRCASADELFVRATDRGGADLRRQSALRRGSGEVLCSLLHGDDRASSLRSGRMVMLPNGMGQEGFRSVMRMCRWPAR